MIKFEKVTKVYQNGHVALNNINLSLKSGEMTFVTGHSGAGKSTLLKSIMGLVKPTSGIIRVSNSDINKISNWQQPFYRRHIGMIMQNPLLLPSKTVFENVEMPLLIAGIDDTERKRRVRAALDKVDLLKKEKDYPIALSTGEQQRVGIARAVVNKPNIILADEPTGNLDPVLSSEIMKLFEAFRQVGVCILIATHDLALIARMQYRIITLANGVLLGFNDSEATNFTDNLTDNFTELA